MKKWILAVLTAIFLVLPGQPGIAHAEESGWIYDWNAQTLTSGNIVIENVSHDGGNLTIGRNMAKDFVSLDLSMDITDECGDKLAITELDHYAFIECEKLSSIILPDTLTSIGSLAFHRTAIESLNIPDSVTSIGEEAFSCCAICNIHLPNQLTSIPQRLFFACGGLYEVEIPKNVSSIGNSAFEGCWQLNSIGLPTATTTIGNSAFSGCYNLREVNIAGNLQSIGDSAFLKCGNLKTIRISTSIPPEITNANVFEGCRSLDDIIVPSASLDMYKSHSGWKRHKSKLKPGYFLTLNGKPYQDRLYLEGECISVAAPEMGPCQTVGGWNVVGAEPDKNSFLPGLLITMPGNDVSAVPAYIDRHSWGVDFWDWSSNGRECKLSLHCGNGDHSKMIAANVTSSIKTPASCFSDGVTEYTATASVDGETFSSTTQRTDIPASHAWGKPDWIWSEDDRSCKVTFVCVNDPSHTETVEAEVTSSVKAPATCTEDGVTAYTATTEHGGETFTATTERADIPVTGHTFENGICTKCGAKDPNHKPVEKPVAPEGETGNNSRPDAPNNPGSKPNDNQIENPSAEQNNQDNNEQPGNQDDQGGSNGGEVLVQTGDASLAFAAVSCLGGLIAATCIGMHRRAS